MEEIYGYHMTSKANVHSILLNGLVPSIGANSQQVYEHNLLTYFTTYDCVDTWIKRFNLDRDDIVLLKFSCRDYVKRLDSANDFVTKEIIPANNIIVVGDEETLLEDYYLTNKEMFDYAENKKVVAQIKTLVDRLGAINGLEIVADEGWNYTEVDPDILTTMDVLKRISSLDNKDDYKNILCDIRNHTLDCLVDNDLGVTSECELFKSINSMFDNAMTGEPKISLFEKNCLTVLIGVNLLYRQLDRYHRIGKKYEDKTGWRFDTLEGFDIPEKSTLLTNLFEETKILYESSKKIHM